MGVSKENGWEIVSRAGHRELLYHKLGRRITLAKVVYVSPKHAPIHSEDHDLPALSLRVKHQDWRWNRVNGEVKIY